MHFLDVTSQLDDLAVGGTTQQPVEELAGPAQLVDGFEQRNETDPGNPAVQIDEAGISRQHRRRQHIIDTARHRNDVRLDRTGTEPVQSLPNGDEGPERVGLSIIENRRRRSQRPPVGQLFGEEGRTGGPVQRVVPDPDAFVELLQHSVMAVGVFSDVHGGQVEPEDGHVPHEPQQNTVADEPPGIGMQRTLHDPQFVEQLPAGPVVLAGRMSDIVCKAMAGVEQALVDEGTLEPVWLIPVECVEALPHIRQGLTIFGQGLSKLISDVPQTGGGGQLFGQFLHLGHQIAEAVIVLHLEHPHGHRRRHRWVTVAVSSHPGAETERGSVGSTVETQPLEVDGYFFGQRREDLIGELIQIEDC